MRILKVVLPNLSIALTLAMMVVIYLDRRNPMMGFLAGAPFLVLALLAGAASLATAVVLFATSEKYKKPVRKTEKLTNNT